MRELSLQEVHAEDLQILNDIHKFCCDNCINYSLAYGTLLGAIRHGGFIPWDDDIDIMMPRKDFEKFCMLYKGRRYQLICSGNDKNCWIAYAKVCDMDRTVVLNSSWTTQKTGAWVDIFPIDGAEDDYQLFCKRYMSIANKWIKLFKNRIINRGVNDENSSKMNYLICLLDKLHLTCINRRWANYRLRYINKAAQMVPFGDTEHCSQMVCCDDGVKSYYRIADFQEYVDIPFEGHCFKAISGYQNVLKQLYGEYMTLPPEDKRIPNFGSLKLFWRK